MLCRHFICRRQFQSTLPRRERLYLPANIISIHAPAKGATQAANRAIVQAYISIHAPAKGATAYKHSIFYQTLGINCKFHTNFSPKITTFYVSSRHFFARNYHAFHVSFHFALTLTQSMPPQDHIPPSLQNAQLFHDTSRPNNKSLCCPYPDR